MSLIKRTGPVDRVWKVWPIRKKEAPRLFARWHGQFGARARAAGACGTLLNRGLVRISLSLSLSRRGESSSKWAAYVVMVRRLFYVPSRRAFQSQTLGPLNLSHAERNEEAFAAGVFSSFGRSVSEQRSVQQRRVSRRLLHAWLALALFGQAKR